MRLFIDMDGVLADFFSAAAKVNNKYDTVWSDLDGREIVRCIDGVRNTPGFFLDLNPFAMANTLVLAAKNIAGEFSILSSPMAGHATCAEEKRLWLKKFIHLDPEEVIITDDKPQFARGNVLIDDYGVNIRDWQAAGGYGIEYQADEDNIADALTILNLLYKNQK